MGPKSLARSALWADGIAGWDLGPDPEGVDATFRRAEDAWTAAGRVEKPRLTTSSWFALGDGASDRLYGHAYDYLANFGDRAAGAMAGLCRLSDTGALRETLAALRETGCDEFILVPTTSDVREIDRVLAVL
jgi:hypothetical protein